MAKFPLPFLSSLRAFEAAARHQSIRRACEELNITHPAVSRHLRKLELELGRNLFERHHRKLALTDAGIELFAAVTAGFSQIQRAFVHLDARERTQRLIICVDPDFAGLWLVPRLADFYAIVPKTRVEILAGKSPESFRHPRLTCVIQYAEAGWKQENCELLFRSQLFPVCTKRVAGSPRLRSADDLRHHVLLHDRSTAEWDEYLQRYAGRSKINSSVGPVFSETALCLDAASRGQGVALGDDFLAASYLAEGRLVKPFGSAVPSKNAYFLGLPDHASKQSAVNAFRTWLLKGIERRRSELGHA